MRNWVGTRIREDSLAVPCRSCRAIKGQECRQPDGTPLVAFPAHASRMSDTQKEPGR